MYVLTFLFSLQKLQAYVCHLGPRSYPLNPSFFPLFVNEEVAYIFVIKKLGFVNLNKKSQICLIDGIVNILFYSFPNFL